MEKDMGEKIPKRLNKEPLLEKAKATNLMVFVLPAGVDKSTSQVTKVTSADWAGEYIPQTALGKSLMALRKKAIASGMKLLSADEVLEEVKHRRGENDGNNADLY